MHSPDLMDASPIVSENVPLENGRRKQEGTSLGMPSGRRTDLVSGVLGDSSPTCFPSLTGLRLRTKAGEVETVIIDSRVTLLKLEYATASLGTPPVAALQAAWAVILSTYTAAQEDLVYTTLIDSSASHDPGHLLEGTFHPIQTRISLDNPQGWGQMTISSILKRLTESNALSVVQIKQRVTSTAQCEGPSKHGTMIGFKSKECSGNDADLGSRLIEGEELDISLVVWPDIAGCLKFELSYTNKVSNESSAIVMLEQLDDILAFILANPSKPIAKSLAAIRPSLFSVSNMFPEESIEMNIERPYLHAQFENFAQCSPHCVALDFRTDINSQTPGRNTTWTYEQLNDRANIFAMYLLREFGEMPNKVVPICMERCPELYVAVLGILKTGGAWCPIDVSFPARRRHDLIARTGARMVVVAEQKLPQTNAGIPKGVIAVDITRIRDTGRVEAPLATTGGLAYLIWTSGTTGDPKGVPIHHKAAVASMRALQRSIPVDVTGGVVRCLQFSHFTFDVFVQDLFFTWGVGGTVISSTREIILGSFAELATNTNATHAHLTPAFAASIPRKRCPSLQVVTMIGEKLPQAVADDWGRDIRAFNTYGPAETTIVSTLRQFGAAGDEIRSENIGFPLASVSAFVMHADEPVMRQAVGELALGGPQLSKGYWHDPARSSGKFVWSERYGRQLYMTGDLVRQIYDGSLEFVGRTDDLIKIQGIRVELSEIGYCLSSCHTLVEQVEVQYLDRQDRPTKVIVAFLATPTLGTTQGVGQLIANEVAAPIAKSALVVAEQGLPKYMIPRVFLIVNCIPRTSSAKTDKAVLEKIYGSIDLGIWERSLWTNKSDIEDMSPWNRRETNIIAIVARISGVSPDAMSRATDLRSIGIDSIAATRLARLIGAEGFSLSVADILRCQILKDLVEMTERSRIEHSREAYDLEAFHNAWHMRVAKKIERTDVFVAPALPLQEAVLSESMQNPSAYWSHAFLSLDAHVDGTRLYEAWQQVVRNTEALRIGFLPSATLLEDGDESLFLDFTFVQLIYETSSVDFTSVKSSENDTEHLASERARAVAEGHQENRFRDPLLDVTVFEQPNNRIMMVSVHHAVRDETSLDFIIEDLGKIYQHNGKDSIERHQWRNALQVMLPTEAQRKKDTKFWSEALEDFAISEGANTWPDLSGKILQRGSPAAGFISQTRALNVNYRDLQGAAFSLGASSVASILRVAWGTILLMYLETDKVVFAETWSNRVDDSMLADVVGPLLIVLPVPFRASGSARETLAAQSHFHRKATTHRSIHSRVIRKLLGSPENESLYPAVFNFFPDFSDDRQNGYYSLWDKVDSIVGFSVEHPVALNVIQTSNGVLELEISARQDVMANDHLAILALQVEASVEMIIKSPDIPLTQLSKYFPAALISKTSVSFSEEVRLAWTQSPTDWVDHYAAVHPNWPAAQVVNSFSDKDFQSETWNFAELRSAYRRVAAFIDHSGHVNRMIAVCLDRRIEAYAVILGIMASGNTYLPIDEDLPQERKLYLLRDSTAAMLFTTKSFAPDFSNTFPKSCTIYVDDKKYREEMGRFESFGITSLPKASDNAYLLYTSGSTGVPKGVLVGRGNLCSFVEGLSEFICPLIPGMKTLPGKGKYLGLASRAFDVHIAEMFLAWRQGLAAVTAPRMKLLDNLELALRKLKITHASFVPSLIDQAGLDPANLPDLHYLGVGGEKMSKNVIDTWASNENAALVNAYGPTEMSIGCTAAKVTPESNSRNVGRPYGNSVAHVLVPGSDEYTMRGVAGELCFTGDLVANGYLNRPDAKGFVNDFDGERMYRTGDIVRLMADDSVEYLRREDDQTKLRGQRLELGEISEAIRWSATTTLGLDRIGVATMVAQHPKLSKPQLVSFVVPVTASNKGLEAPRILCSAKDDAVAAQVQANCRKALPPYMVPDLIIPISRMPLAPSSGKADLKRLKILFADMTLADMVYHNTLEHPDQSKSNCRDLTEAELIVRDAVTSTLGVDAASISANTNIFRLGLDSLSAISLAIKLHRLGYDCTVSNVLRNPVLEQLASLPRNGQDKGATAGRLTRLKSILTRLESRFRAFHSHGLADSSIQAVKPCLPLQETLVATSLNLKSTALYINHLPLRLSTEIDCIQLYKAWTRVVADHDILRTCFQEYENRIVQVILRDDEKRSVSWNEITASDPESVSKLQQNKSAEDIISHIASKPPVRLTLVRPPSGDRCSVLSITIHHALYDKESIAMVLEDLHLRYHSAIPLVHTHFDAMIEYVCSQDQEAAESFWRGYLADYRLTTIMNEADSTSEDHIDISFPSVNRILAFPTAELEDFSSSISGTLTSTIQAAFGIILAQILSTNDVVFGVVLSGRTVPIEKPHTIVAPCITTIAQRVNLRNSNSTIVDVMKVAQQGFVESLEFQHTALRQVHRWLKAERPLFDCLVSFVQKTCLKPSQYPQVWTELDGAMPDEFPLSVEFEEDSEAGRINASCTFSPAFGHFDRAASLLEDIDLLLGALVRRENVTTKDLGMSDSNASDSRPKSQFWDESSWTQSERTMQELAADICGISTKDISKGASFFGLGIDSITAIRFARRLRQLGMECSSADVMRFSCIGALAHHIDGLRPNVDNFRVLADQPQEINVTHIIPKIPTLSPGDNITGVYVCTPLQSSMLTQTLGSDGRLYSHHHAVEIAHHIDLNRLKEAWECLARQTEILRTTFYFSDASNSWLAAVHQDIPIAWEQRNIQISVSDWLTVVSGRSEFNEKEDFERPPWKATILRTAMENVLVVSMHHSLYDGVSIKLLFEDLASLYQGLQLPQRTPFSDAAKAITKSGTDTEEFWLQQLNGFEDSEVSASQTATEPKMMEVETNLEMSIDDVLRGCKDLGVTIQTAALLAFGKSLACVLKRRDVVFGHVVGGRSLAMPGADEVVGPLFNTVPCRIVFDKTYVTNKIAAMDIQQFSGDSQPHQHAPLGRIQQVWRQKIGNADAQLFDSLFVFQNTVNRSSPTEGLWTLLDSGEAVAPTEYSTNFEFEQREGGITLRVASHEELTSRESLLDWLADFEQIFQDILTHPQRSVMAIPASFQGLPLTIRSEKSRSPQQEEIQSGLDLDSIRTALSNVSGFFPENIPLNASIFSLGLDSISAIQIAAACRKEGHNVSVADVLQGRCLGGICQRLRDKDPAPISHLEAETPLTSPESRSKALSEANVRSEDVEEFLPCLAGQIYHLASWLKSGRKTCEATWTFQCSTRLNVDDLRSAWRGLRERHSVLRTIFVTISPKETVQAVLRCSALDDESFSCIEAEDDAKSTTIGEKKREVRQPFDFLRPPSKLCLVRGDIQSFIILKLHHVTYDAWTLQTLVKDLAALYHGIRLPSLPRFDSFIRHTTQSLHSQAEGYWRKSLQQCQQTFLQPSINHSDPPVPNPANTNAIFVFIKTAIPNLHTLETTSNHSSLTLPTLLLLAYARILSRLTSTPHPTFGLYQAGRSSSFDGIAQLCAPTLNVTPVVIPDALTSPVLESAQRLQADLAERVEFEQSYLGEVVEWVGFGGRPLFNTFVNILADEGRRDGMAAETVTGKGKEGEPLLVPCEFGDSPVDLGSVEPMQYGETAVDGLEVGYLAEKNLYLDVVRDVEGDCIDFGIRCDGELMDEEMVRKFADQIAREVEDIVKMIGKGEGEKS